MNDSFEQKKKMEYEMAKRRFLVDKERKRKIDEPERCYVETRYNMIIQKTQEQLFNK